MSTDGAEDYYYIMYGAEDYYYIMYGAEDYYIMYIMPRA